MSYINDPNTRRLATNCFICRTPLRDAKSVELGIGPVCRKKHIRGGWTAMWKRIDAPTRKKANKLIHEAGIAADASWDERNECSGIETVLRCADDLQALGLPELTEIIRKRFVQITIAREDAVPVYQWDRRTRSESAVEGKTRNVIKVTTPYSPDFNRLRRQYVGGQHRPVKNGKDFHWEFAASEGANVLSLLSQVFAGRPALGDKGVFFIPTPSDYAKTYGSAS
jgi:hypothetical protein